MKEVSIKGKKEYKYPHQIMALSEQKGNFIWLNLWKQLVHSYPSNLIIHNLLSRQILSLLENRQHIISAISIFVIPLS
jgi:hypothetical protein